MTEENTNTETAPAETSATAETSADENAPANDEFGDADREKMGEVVRKERAAAKAAASRADQAEKRLAELEANELRRSIAEEKGLSSEQAAFLAGDSAEEMSASADALLAAFPAKSHPLRGPFERLRTGATGASEPAESVDSIANRVLE